MIFKLLKNLVYAYEITVEQLILLDLLNGNTEEFEFYINTFPEDKKKYIQNLLRRGFIKEEDGEVVLEDKGLEVVNNIKHFNDDLCDDLFKTSENEIPELVDEYRKLFEGLRLGSMGSKSSCINKMKKFFKNNPKVTKEEVIKATKTYIDSFNGNYTYLQQADYFINKNEGSRLETWIEEIRKNDNPLGDWTTTIA